MYKFKNYKFFNFNFNIIFSEQLLNTLTMASKYNAWKKRDDEQLHLSLSLSISISLSL